MNRHTFITAALVFCFLSTAQAPAATGTTDGSPTISLTKLKVNDKTLEMSYEIKNGSGQDIWICEGVKVLCRNFEVEMADDGHTLLIRRRSDVPMNGYGERPYYRYVRICKGSNLQESLLLSLPVHPYRILLGGRRSLKDIQDAKRIVFEIGYYSGDLPNMIVDMLEEAEKYPDIKHVNDIGYPTDAIGWLGSSVSFTRQNESVLDKHEQVSISWTDQKLKGEKIIRTTVDGLHVPYIEQPLYINPRLQDISTCTRIEIKYEPSMFDYFFPYTAQDQLLSTTETSYLKSHDTVLIDDRELIRAMADEIKKGFSVGQIVRESRSAHVICYRGKERLTSFVVYDNTSIETEDKQYLWYRENLQSMRMLTPQVVPFELRTQCAKNLVDLWHRLRLFYKAEKKRIDYSSFGNRIVYPPAAEWCDAMVQTYEITSSRQSVMRAHKCPSAGEGKNHYAINPNCRPDSKADMVLQFETKGGWNQHGGPELFTFDNHDPKGGCVLLNDGTVKFIRTSEELQQLRWE